MNDNKKQEIDKEVLAEEYRLGKEYYNKLLEESPKKQRNTIKQDCIFST